jgi:hypothetical protein
MWWAGHVAYTGRRELHSGFLDGEPEGKRPLGRPHVDRSIILKWHFR